MLIIVLPIPMTQPPVTQTSTPTRTNKSPMSQIPTPTRTNKPQLRAVPIPHSLSDASCPQEYSGILNLSMKPKTVCGTKLLVSMPPSLRRRDWKGPLGPVHYMCLLG